MKVQFTVTLEASDMLEADSAKKNLQKLCDKMGAKKLNKLMKLYDDPINRMKVEGFLLTL